MSYNSGVIGLVVSNRPRATRSADLKLLARLLPELYSTQSYYHYLLFRLADDVPSRVGFVFERLLCFLIVGIHASGISIPLSLLMLLE